MWKVYLYILFHENTHLLSIYLLFSFLSASLSSLASLFALLSREVSLWLECAPLVLPSNPSDCCGTTMEGARRSPWFWSWRPDSCAHWSHSPGDRPCCMLPGDVCILGERQRKGGHLGGAYWTSWWYRPIWTCKTSENCPLILTPWSWIVHLVFLFHMLLYICLQWNPSIANTIGNQPLIVRYP